MRQQAQGQKNHPDARVRRPRHGHSGAGPAFKTNVWVSDDGKRVAALLLNGRTADDRGDAIAGGALAQLYCAA
jgi:hypothetical protein